MSIDIKEEIIPRKTRNNRKRRSRRIIIIGIAAVGIVSISIIVNLNSKTNVKNTVVEEKNYEDIIKESQELEDNEDKNLEENEELDKTNVINKDYLMLINKNIGINKDYVPEDLVIPNVQFKVANDMCMEMRRDAAAALEDMFNDAKADGVNLIAISGYRSYEYQRVVYDRSVYTEGQEYTNNYVAVPGTSEHQTGLVMDLLSDEYSSLDEGFENTRAFNWLINNMSNYGFILRYPKGKEDITGYDYEPWHIRYVGIDAAKEIMNNGITLEEYLLEI